MLDTSTFGYSAMNIWPTAAAIAKPEAANAQPSLSVAASRWAKITAITPKIWVGWGTVPPPITTSVQIAHAMLTTIATTPSTRAESPRAVADLAGRAQRQEGRAVQQREHQQGHPGHQPVAGQQVEEVAGEVVLLR